MNLLPSAQRACETFTDIYDSIYDATCYEEYSAIGDTGPLSCATFHEDEYGDWRYERILLV